MPIDLEAVLAAERARAAALVARDIEMLNGCPHEDLVYVHATGVRHDRAQLLHFVGHGPRFVAVELRETSVDGRGDIALVFGELHMTLQRPGDAAVTEVRSWASEAWCRGADRRWQLRLFQSTRLAP
jgi:ketosteroid isomerase-like protein